MARLIHVTFIVETKEEQIKATRLKYYEYLSHTMSSSRISKHTLEKTTLTNSVLGM